MPVQELAQGDRLQLRVVIGTDPETGPIYRSRSYSNINPAVDSEHLHTVAEGIGDLTDDDLSDIVRHKSYTLVDMG